MSTEYTKDERRRHTCERLVAPVNRSKGVYKQAGMPGVTFCEKGGMME